MSKNDIDIDIPGRLLAQRRSFEEVMAALEDVLQRAHAVHNYGAIVHLEGIRITVLSHYERRVEDIARALDNYLSMQPYVVERAIKTLDACAGHPELVARYFPQAIASISEIAQQPHLEALLARLEAVYAAGQDRATP